MSHLLFIFLGGGLGAISRFGLDHGLHKLTRVHAFPIGILACNLLGCFLIGCAVSYATKAAPTWFAPLIITGFLGGFTTFSTFSKDSLHLFGDGHSTLALANILLSVIPGVIAVWFGMKVTGFSGPLTP
jgi:CrcB protein